jgi:flagellin-like protein
MRPTSSSDRGISPVIGVVLLVVIAAAMAILTGSLLLDFGSQLSDPPPFFSERGHVELTVDDDSIQRQDLVLVHQGGQAVETDRLEIVVDTGNGTFRTTPRETAAIADGTWTVGEPLNLPLNETQVCTDGSEGLDVQLNFAGEQTFPIASATVPVVEGGFTIENGEVVPVTDYTADATILGTGFTYGAGGPRIDIRLDVRIGNTSYDPWPGNVNNNGNPRSHTFTGLRAGDGIAIAATGDRNGAHIAPRTRWSNETNGWVAVLRDGDTPTSLDGFGDQSSAAAYVSPYVDASGTIDLQDNQAIYLFELGNSQTGAAADYQDVVVLVTLTTQQEAATKRLPSGETAVVCPA